MFNHSLFMFLSLHYTLLFFFFTPSFLTPSLIREKNAGMLRQKERVCVF